MMIFYYSGCGNSRYVAQWLGRKLDQKLVFIPDAEREGAFEYTLAEGEELGFVFPVYCWAPPELVTRFVEQLQLHGTPSYTFMVVTCGDNTGKTESLFAHTLRRKGLHLQMAVSLAMPNTYINIAGMVLDSHDTARAKVDDTNRRLPQVAEAVKNRQPMRQMVEGPQAWLRSHVIKPLFYRFLVRDKHFTVSQACTSCGLCQQSCPLGNIRLVDGRPQWQGNCTTCMSCYHHCPQNAIHFGKATQDKGQYYFREKDFNL